MPVNHEVRTLVILMKGPLWTVLVFVVYIAPVSHEVRTLVILMQGSLWTVLAFVVCIALK